MKKVVVLGISLVFLLMLTPVDKNNNDSTSNTALKTEQVKVGHPILPPV